MDDQDEYVSEPEDGTVDAEGNRVAQLFFFFDNLLAQYNVKELFDWHQRLSYASSIALKRDSYGMAVQYDQDIRTIELELVERGAL